jgi:prophage DNA circulation protein
VPSAPAHHSASSPAQSHQVSTAQCADKAALETSLTNLLQVSIRQRTLKQVQADVEDMQAKLSALKGDMHGAFSVQINALQSALTKLQAAVKGVSNGSSSVAEVRTAADGVTTATANLGTAFAQAGCIGGD